MNIMRIGIIRALNECTGRLFRATTRHNHKSSDMQSDQVQNTPVADADLVKYCSFTLSCCTERHRVTPACQSRSQSAKRKAVIESDDDGAAPTPKRNISPRSESSSYRSESDSSPISGAVRRIRLARTSRRLDFT